MSQKNKSRKSDQVGRRNTLLLATLLLALGSPMISHAEPLKASGLYSEAKLNAKTVEPAARAQAAALRPQGKIDGAKQWVAQKWNSIRAAFGDSDGEAKQIVNLPKAPQTEPARVVASDGAPGLVSEPADSLPSKKPLDQGLQAPTAPTTAEQRGPIDVPGVKRTATGVASYDLSSAYTNSEAAPVIPRLNIEKESRLTAAVYALDERLEKTMRERVVQALESPTVMGDKDLRALLTIKIPRAGEVTPVKDAVYSLKGKVNRTSFDKVVMNLKPELEIKLKKFVPLTAEETRFLSGLLLFQDGEQCQSAIGLFHKLSKSKGWEAESNYYMAMCSKQLGLGTDFHERARRVLETQDLYYSPKILAEFSPDVPYEIQDALGNALLKAASNPKIVSSVSPVTLANVSYLLADFGVSSERFKTALEWSKKVPESHPKYLKAQFLQALSEYQAGSKDEAIKIQDRIVADKSTDKAKMEFQALVALNAGRMHFQERNFKAAHENFQKVYKDHPLWLQSLHETGWAQLMDGDFEGAIGNMYSVQSPFFRFVYKPESYVIRTIGYLNLCQYGDAYRTLSGLEREYRPYLDRMDAYIKRAQVKATYYQTVRSFVAAPKEAKEVDGLPMPVVREMARHRDFTNLQKALNRQIDERPNYSRMDFEVEKQLRRAQTNVTNLRKYADDLRRKLAAATGRSDQQQQLGQLRVELESALDRLNDGFFQVDLFSEAKLGMDEYRKEVIGGADQRIAGMRTQMEKTLGNRLLRMKVDLARMLDNNELLRYEVFAGSGENIRFQVAGGDTGKRIPASILPKSKSLQWDFDGEFWEDEIGHYRSSLRNNCPQKDEPQRSTASLNKDS